MTVNDFKVVSKLVDCVLEELENGEEPEAESDDEDEELVNKE